MANDSRAVLRRTEAAGYTLVELMVVVFIIGILSAIVVFSARRPVAETQLDAAVAGYRWALNSGRQRAMATHTSYFVELSRGSGFRYCRANSGLTDCDSTGEVSAWHKTGEKVVLVQYAKATNVGAPTGATAFTTSTVRLLVKATGVVDGDPATTAADEGFTLYLRTDDGGKERKVYLFPLTGQSRVADKW